MNHTPLGQLEKEIDEIDALARKLGKAKTKEQIETSTRKYDSFWKALTSRQKNLFLAYEEQVNEDSFLYNEIVFDYAFQRGLFIGFMTAFRFSK